MSNRIDWASLIGRSIVGSVGEPWDFTSEAGDNKITGMVSSISDPNTATSWVKISISPFRFEGAKIFDLVCIPRYIDIKGLVSVLAEGEKATVNMHFKKDGTAFAVSYFGDRARHDDKTSFLVGSIWLNPEA